MDIKAAAHTGLIQKSIQLCIFLMHHLKQQQQEQQE